jgi:hypothetical protein
MRADGFFDVSKQARITRDEVPVAQGYQVVLGDSEVPAVDTKFLYNQVRIHNDQPVASARVDFSTARAVSREIKKEHQAALMAQTGHYAHDSLVCFEKQVTEWGKPSTRKEHTFGTGQALGDKSTQESVLRSGSGQRRARGQSRLLGPEPAAPAPALLPATGGAAPRRTAAVDAFPSRTVTRTVTPPREEWVARRQAIRQRWLQAKSKVVGANKAIGAWKESGADYAAAQ